MFIMSQLCAMHTRQRLKDSRFDGLVPGSCAIGGNRGQ